MIQHLQRSAASQVRSSNSGLKQKTVLFAYNVYRGLSLRQNEMLPTFYGRFVTSKNEYTSFYTNWYESTIFVTKHGCESSIIVNVSTIHAAKSFINCTLHLKLQLTYLLTYSLTHSMVQNIILKAYQIYPTFFMEPEGSSPCSQKPASGPYPQPLESSSPHPYLSH